MSDNTELVPVGNQQLSRPSDQEDQFALLRLAVERNASPEALAAMMAVRRELNAERSKEAFDRAMAAFQSECPTIIKAKEVQSNGRTLYKYAPLEDIIEQSKPFLQRHGFSFTLDTDTSSEQGWVIAKCHVTHAQGHMRTSTAKFPLGTKTGIMSETQVYASALTFASRRVLCNAFGIVPAGEDMDGRLGVRPERPVNIEADMVKPVVVKQETKPAPTSIATVNELKRKLWHLLEPKIVGITAEKLQQWCVDEMAIMPEQKLSTMTADELTQVIDKVNNKLSIER